MGLKINVMIDFGLYCDIKDILKNRKRLKQSDNYNFERCVQMLTEERESENAIFELIQNCDKEMVKRLILYFEKEAPIQKLLDERLNELNSQRSETNIVDYLEQKKRSTPSFYQYMCHVIEEKGFANEADFYNYIGMSRQTFSKLRKQDASISRNHAILMAVGLGLNYSEAVEFMRMAGYVFKSQDTREAIISYVMRNRKYDLMIMEEILFSFGEKTLMDL